MALSLALCIHDENTDTEALLTGLSPAERDQYAALGRNRRRRQYLASRWLIRRHLAAELDADPRALDIVHRPGRPPSCTATPRRLGLSHSGPACLSLLGETGPTGCDIEAIRERRFAPQRLAELYFDPAESRALHATPPGDRLADFYRLWTLKEACLKARGLGLAAGLAQPAFAVSPYLRCLRAPAGGPWFFGALELALPVGRFALAIAAQSREAMIEAVCFHAAAPGKARTPLAHGWQTTTVEGTGGDR